MAKRAEIERLIQDVAVGSRSAFTALYDATSAKLFGVCVRVLNDRSEAEDALQEIYLRIWRNAGRYSAGGYSPMTWLITIARNAAIDRLRARRPAAAAIGSAADLPDPAPSPEDAAAMAADVARLHLCLTKLDAAHADAIRGVYLSGESYKALADRHGVPLNTMRTWLRRGLLKLKECLSR